MVSIKERDMKTEIRRQENSSKITMTKKSLIQHLIRFGASTLADIAKDLDLSIPTVAKFTTELIKEGYILDLGKTDAFTGRKPNLYGLNPKAGYFVGIDVQHKKVCLGMTDFAGTLMGDIISVPYLLEDTPQALDRLYTIIKDYVGTHSISKKKIMGIGVNIAGKVNPMTGYSYSYFQFDKEPLADTMTQQIGFPVYLDNDSRAMAYGEYMSGDFKEDKKSLLFINLNWGLGAGLIIDGKPYYGKSGFSGEIGHICALDNEIICNCGKKGCLETEVSGLAVERILHERMAQGCSTVMADYIQKKGELLLEDFVDAVHKGDVLSIEIVEQLGFILGRALAGLVNLLNPDMVVVGGPLAGTGDYLRHPMQSAIQKYSLSLLIRETQVSLSPMNERSALIGACLLSRSRILDII